MNDNTKCPRSMVLTIFERIGGEDAVEALVTLFLSRAFNDPNLRIFFADISMPKQAEKQKSFLTMALHGSENSDGEQLRESHARLLPMGMNDYHFDLVIKHLQESMYELNVTPELIGEVVTMCESMREYILGRAPQT